MILTPPSPTLNPCDATPLGCAAKDAVSDAAGAVADNFMTQLIDTTADGLIKLIGYAAMSILKVPSPTLGTVEGGGVTPSNTLAAVWGSLSWLVMAVAVLSLMLTTVRIFWTLQAQEGRHVLRLLFNVIAASTVVVGVTIMMIRFGDEFSPWALMKIGGLDEGQVDKLATDDQFAKELVGLDPGQGAEALGNFSFVALLMLAVTTLGVVTQWLFLLVRSPLIVVMVAFIPVFAAASGTRAGQERLNKALMFLVAVVIYKPVVAIIYGTGLRMMKAEDQVDDPIVQFIWGSMLIIMAALALPALVKFLVPEAGAGTSSAFSGAGGVAAAGAAVYGASMLAGALTTGGGSAAAGGGAGAARAGGAGPTAPVPGGGPGGGASGGSSSGASGGPPGAGGGPGGSFGSSGSSGPGGSSTSPASGAVESGSPSTEGSPSPAEGVAPAGTGASTSGGPGSSSPGSTSAAPGSPAGLGAGSPSAPESTGGQSTDVGGSVEPPASAGVAAPGGDRTAGEAPEVAPASGSAASTSSSTPGSGAPAAPAAPEFRKVGTRAKERERRAALARDMATAVRVPAQRVARGAAELSQPVVADDQRRR